MDFDAHRYGADPQGGAAVKKGDAAIMEPEKQEEKVKEPEVAMSLDDTSDPVVLAKQEGVEVGGRDRSNGD